MECGWVGWSSRLYADYKPNLKFKIGRNKTGRGVGGLSITECGHYKV